jgi:hypothetical protein
LNTQRTGDGKLNVFIKSKLVEKYFDYWGEGR